MWKLIALSFAAFICFINAQQIQTFHVAGHVVRERNGNPVRGARVTIFLSDRPERQISCVSGENGEFSFTDMPAGKYSLQVNYHGWTKFYRQYEEFSTAIVAGPGLDSEHIVFALDSPASIVGSVLDEAGDPVRNGTVYLFTRNIHRGTTRTELKETKMTASDGTFHFTRLDPGIYYVGIIGRPWYAQGPTYTGNSSGESTVIMPEPEFDVAYPLTYYAGATSPEGATPIQLDQGSRAEIEFHLQPVPALHIAFDGIEKPPDQQIIPMLEAIGPGGILLNGPMAWGMPSGITGVAPGNYIVSLSLGGNGKQNLALGSYAVNWTGDTTLHLSDNAKTTVSGNVISDTEIPQGLAVLLADAANSNRATGFVDRNGSFEMSNVSSGSYDVFLANTPELYMKSVNAKGGTYSNGVLQVTQGAHVELSINVQRGLATVRGLVLREGKPFAGSMVLLIPKDGNHDKYIPRDQSDSDGTFELQFAAPGHYTLIAIDDGRGLEYANPAIMAPYLNSGKQVELPLPEGTKINIDVQPRRDRGSR